MPLPQNTPVPKELKPKNADGIYVGRKVRLLPASTHKDEPYRDVDFILREFDELPRMVEFKCIAATGNGKRFGYCQLEIITDRTDLKPGDIVQIKEIVRVRNPFGRILYVTVYIWEPWQRCSVNLRSWFLPRAWEECKVCERLSIEGEEDVEGTE